MSTTHRIAVEGVTVTREQRDALHQEIRQYEMDGGTLEDIGLCIRWGREAEARERWQRVVFLGRLLDDLGWGLQGERDSYALTVDARALEEWARYRLEQTEGCLREYAKTFAEVRAGRDPWAPRDDDDSTLEDDLDQTRRLADADLEAAGACQAILRQLGGA